MDVPSVGVVQAQEIDDGDRAADQRNQYDDSERTSELLAYGQFFIAFPIGL
ncbi:hypothetical protein [Burkholderia glumae]|uniref:hypothetical protein n=1 Tax=Burkholderia glumae TaxID=337 RepID=UPI0020B44DF1|nr:hypothetical protein [Burkholderia glumae]